MCIPELLDEILRIAGVETQMSAWHVSQRWRQSAKFIIESRIEPSFWEPTTGSVPVDYGSIVDSAATTRGSLTQQEIETVVLAVGEAMQRAERGCVQDEGWPQVNVRRKILYFPARYIQAPNLPPTLSAVFDELNKTQHRMMPSTYHIDRDGPTSRNPHRYWLDFSQLSINPHFAALFQTRFKEVGGRIEIELRPNATHDSLVINPSDEKELIDLMGPMLLTQPPCKVMGIYQDANTGQSGRETHETSRK